MIKSKVSPEAKKVRKVSPKEKVKNTNESESLRDAIVEGMKDKKGKEIVCIDLRNIKNSISDFFVVCHADSRTHIDAISRSVEEVVFKKTGEHPLHCEGFANSEWILLDYANVIVHIFIAEKRQFYGIERLWADATIQQVAVNY